MARAVSVSASSFRSHRSRQRRERRATTRGRAAVGEEQLSSNAELFVEELGLSASEPSAERAEALRAEEASLQGEIDAAYANFFGSLVPSNDDEKESASVPVPLPVVKDELSFGEAGRGSPDTFQALMRAAAKEGERWTLFQEAVHVLVLRRDRVREEAASEETAVASAARAAAMARAAAAMEATSTEAQVSLSSSSSAAALASAKRIVLISGFESFNVALYREVAASLKERCAGLELTVFSDRDIEARPAEVAAALDEADAFVGSLLFDFDQVEWLRPKVEAVPVRLVFESALELMSYTQVGSFEMKPPADGKKAGPPPAVKKVLSLFGSGREEDKMVGYLSMLSVGPKLLKFLPDWAPEKVKDLRTWLTFYAYWNQGGRSNVEEAMLLLADAQLGGTGLTPAPIRETPALGVFHPEVLPSGGSSEFYESPADYLAAYRAAKSPSADTPVVAVLLYRKHVITEQPYLAQLVGVLEKQGLIPVPIFINGVEAHTVVRDLLTTEHEATLEDASKDLKKGHVRVDAIVSTVGFPLVGGPAGSMEAGRQADVAKAILQRKNVPYIVAAPLLIQDIESWVRDGVGGLQSTILWALPELDGAIDTVALGGLVGDDIYLAEERGVALAKRLHSWIGLRRKATRERKLAVILYGFPPGVGATGTAALLNVPRSLENLMERLEREGYVLRSSPDEPLPSGDALVEALRALEQPAVASRGLAGAEAALSSSASASSSSSSSSSSTTSHLAGAHAAGADVTASELKEWLRFPQEWGPTEWGPMPYLPSPDALVESMERNWGPLERYSGIRTTASGECAVMGVQVGNVWFGVQPALGVEGDPMRLLFERDLTPHPQYAAFYKWLQKGYEADAILHFGMHGTVEWLPGSPLGNTGLSWSETLLGAMPNAYIYAANNPSESIVAKRRGYGTIVSHNVPPYGRAGLYKQMAELKELLAEYRENPPANAGLRVPILDLLEVSGLSNDVPFKATKTDEEEEEGVLLSADTIEQVPPAELEAYFSDVYTYLGVVENRLFSEGLHTLGQKPTPGQVAQYLEAYFGPETLPIEAATVVAEADTASEDIEALRTRLERTLELDAAPASGAGDGADSSARLAHLEQAIEIRSLLERSTEELDGVIRALNGEYVLPATGGDLLRDGPGVLPTGRNIHALDPYRMPSPAAMQRGVALAEAILDQHRRENGGAYPETVSVNLWGLDAIKTKGESVALALALVGAAPVKEGTGRVVRYELLPLSELGGRPRVDVLCNMSGIFRDTFANVVGLLDDLFQRAASAPDESEADNFIKKHAKKLEKEGVTNGSARLFSNPPGDYGSMVNERVGAGDWEDGAELGDTWAARNAYSYGRGAERGTSRPEVLQSLLQTTDRVVQAVDSVEYGLADIQEYYANTGALIKAAETAKKGTAKAGEKVACSVVECFGKEAEAKSLDETLRLEYRTKLLNPRWAEAMAAQGSGGAYEISQRMTAMIGWGATAGFAEQWVFQGAFDTYVGDQDMREKLSKSNPEAFKNVLRRMLEGAGRGMWEPDAATLAELRSLYEDMDSKLEGVE